MLCLIIDKIIANVFFSNKHFILASANLASTVQFVQTPVISNEECRRTYMSYIKPTNICVSGARGRSSCNGNIQYLFIIFDNILNLSILITR